MGILDKVEEIANLGQRKFVVLWGKSNTGKTEVGSTWPKPMLYMQVGDDGANTIRKKKDIMGLRCDTVPNLKAGLKELINKKGAGYKSIFVDTFSMITNMWIDENALQKKKKMTQQMWGDLKTDTEGLIRMCWELSEYCWVLVSCHEAMDSIEGMEDEILPDARPIVSKGARTYLEGMANYGFHTTRLSREVIENGTEKTVVKYGMHIGPNPYYWTKLQTYKEIKVPATMINPSYLKLKKLGIFGED